MVSPPQGNKLLGFSSGTSVRVHAAGVPRRSDQKSQHAIDLPERFIWEWGERPSRSVDMREREADAEAKRETRRQRE